MLVHSTGCIPRQGPRQGGGGWVSTTTLALNLLAIGVGLVAFYVAYRCWTATRDGAEGQSGSLMEVGEGRSRFIAYSGSLTSGGFIVAILFATFSLLVPLCGR